MRALKHFIEYLCLTGYSRLVRTIPRPWALVLGQRLGTLGWFLRLRRGVLLNNLDRVFPEMTKTEKMNIGRASCRNFARSATEFARFATDRRRVGELVRVSGVDELKAACEEGPGAIIVTGHLGAWALYVTALAANGIPTALLVGKQSNARVDRFIHGIPGNAVSLIGKGPLAPRGVLRSLAAGKAVLIVADQHSRVGIDVPFLGHLCKTLALPGAILAKRPRPLFVLEGFHVGAGKHRVKLSRLQLPAHQNSTLEISDHTLQIAALCNDAIGEAIKRHPEQYFWHHRRWRPAADS